MRDTAWPSVLRLGGRQRSRWDGIMMADWRRTNYYVESAIHL
jgi:hypothetical protein